MSIMTIDPSAALQTLQDVKILTTFFVCVLSGS